MGFYYGPSQPPQPDKEPNGCLDVLAITRAMFAILAVPLGIVVGLIAVVAALVALFSLHWLAGVGGMVVVALAIGAYLWWERRKIRPRE